MARQSGAGRPAGQYTQAVRLFQLYQRLDTAPYGMRVEDLATEMGVTARSIRRDLNALREADQSIENVLVGREHRVRLTRSSRSSVVRMNRFQRYSLGAARRVFDVLKGTPMHDDLVQVFEQLGAGAGAKPAAQAMSERFVFIPEAPKDYRRKKDVVYQVYDGVLRSLTITFLYDGGSSPGLKRTLEPYAMVLYRNGLYVVGKDTEKRATRTFAVERMRLVRSLPNSPFERDPHFDVAKLFDGAFGLIGGGTREDVVVEFEPSVATFVKERAWHPTQRIRVLPNGWVRCSLNVAIGPELIAWILRWGASARVISPPKLVDAMKAEFEKALREYRRSH